MAHPILRSIAFGFMLLAIGSSAAQGDPAPLPLTSCGDHFGNAYYLTGDIDCGGGIVGVNLRARARLELRGFTIRNAGTGLQCFRRCDIVGPGRIEDNYNGIWAPHRVNITGVDVVNSTTLGIGSGRLRLSNSTVSGNRDGVLAGVYAIVTNSSITGNRETGIEAEAAIPPGTRHCNRGRISLRNSTVEGNATDSVSCSEQFCADIWSCFPPTLDETSSCGTSLQYDNEDASWGVCESD